MMQSDWSRSLHLDILDGELMDVAEQADGWEGALAIAGREIAEIIAHTQGTPWDWRGHVEGEFEGSAMSAATKAHIFELLEKAIKAVGQAGNDVEMVDAEDTTTTQAQQPAKPESALSEKLQSDGSWLLALRSEPIYQVVGIQALIEALDGIPSDGA